MTFVRQDFNDAAKQIPTQNGIKANVLAARLTALSQIGRTSEGGVTRFVYTEEEEQAKKLLHKWGNRIGLTMREDAAGNLIGRLEGSNPTLAAVATGSHIDTVANGGAFDGALGALASLSAIESIIEDGTIYPRSLEWLVFANEEGSRFPTGIFGSQVMMGEFTELDVQRYKDNNGITLANAMTEAGYPPSNMVEAQRSKEDFYAFLELHIEQGKQLEDAHIPIGIVSGIAGPLWLRGTFTGESDHAGNTPMTMRRDASIAGAEWIIGIEKLPHSFSNTAVATVGAQEVYPNTPNVITGKSVLTVDIRDIHAETRNQLVDAIITLGEEIASNRGLTFTHEFLTAIDPVPVSEFMQTLLKKSASKLGFASMALPSGAGHDAMIIGRHVENTGMIFVPSVGGTSHSPEEFTSLEDCVRGTAVLKEALVQLLHED
ncbi:Zn-dependent hydrolase [Shouchella patagoniensis]|uniref:Zn-dependent hydrolase n=1 Tax=Shouchella patagoniensis TaxID=228576 RepID=UPI000995726F|nr:Zn-dependent hydrolase [Shouchella patagoniensis]